MSDRPKKKLVITVEVEMDEVTWEQDAAVEAESEVRSWTHGNDQWSWNDVEIVEAHWKKDENSG